jgi:lambda family phage tail tape measure protein
MNFAQLGISVDSSEASSAADDLSKLVNAAESAEKAVDSLADANKGLEESSKGVSSSESAAAATADKAAAARERQSVSSRKVSESAAGEIAVISRLEKSFEGNLSSIEQIIQAEGLLEQARKGGLVTIEDQAKYQDRITAGYDKLEKAEAKEAAQKQRAIAAQERQVDALKRTVNSIDPVTGKLAKLEAQEESLREALSRGIITQDQYAASMAKIGASRSEIQNTGGAINQLGLNSKGARENVLQLGNALAHGNWTVAANNIAQIGAGARGGAAGFLAMAVPAGVAVAAIGGLAAAYYLGDKEQREFNKNLILTGKYAGVSANGLADMARQVSNTVGTTGAAASALASMAGGGKIAGDSFVSVAEAALSMEQATGVAVEKTIAEFAKLADEPVRASKELNEQYNYLTASVYSQIVALEKQGDHVGAVKLATDTYAETVKTRSGEILKDLGYVERAWLAVLNAARTAGDGMKNIGRDDINADIAAAQRRLARAENGDIGLFQNRQEMIDAAREQLDMLNERKKAEADIAAYEREQAIIQREAIDAMAKVDALAKSSWTNEQKRTEVVKEYRKQLEAIRKANPDDARLDQATVDRNIRNINVRYKDQGTGTAVDTRVANEVKNQLAQVVGYYRNAQKELEASQRAGVVSQESYAEQRMAIISQERDEVVAAYQREITALEEARAKQGVSAAQRIRLDQRVATARSNMVKAQQDAESQLNQIALSEQGRLARQEQAVMRYTLALQAQADALREQGLRAAAGVGMGARDRAQFEQLNALQDRYNQQLMELDNQRSDPSREMSEQEYQRRLAALKASHSDMRETVVSNYEAIAEAESDWQNGAKAAWADYLDSARNVAGMTNDLFSNAFRSMEDGVVNFAVTGKASFSDFTKSVLADMARIATRQASSSLLNSVISIGASAAGSHFGSVASVGSTQAGYTGTDFSSWVSGQRASGGPVSPNSLYEVNERGPELLSQGGRSYLMVGGQGGSIKPLGANPATMSAGNVYGGGSISVYAPITFEGGDAEPSNIDQALLQRGMEVGIRKLAQDEIGKASRTGGQIWKIANGRG